ncbi:hypothetical protein WJX73_001954 [Symbiochloris irregularis]|uniref:Peptidase C14 caspase domain-containing protein n=1 Tax=Symbiochloris irregularis TaxID=706552 RepID=A0AAW1NVG1_9CHLO
MGGCLTKSQPSAELRPVQAKDPKTTEPERQQSGPIKAHRTSAGHEDSPQDEPLQRAPAAHDSSSEASTSLAGCESLRQEPCNTLREDLRRQPIVSAWNLEDSPAAIGFAASYPVPCRTFIPQPSMRHRNGAARDAGMLQDQEWQPAAKRALLVGCTYADRAAPGQPTGSAVDVLRLAQMLVTHFGFKPCDIVVLHDNHTHANYLPTKANIREGARWLLTGCNANDSLVFAYVGQAADVELAEELNADIRQGEEQGLLPCDYQQEGALSWEQLCKALKGQLVEGARLHCFLDVGGVAALTQPCKTFMRKDGWLEWEEHAIADALEEPCAGGLVFSLAQAIEQGHKETYNSLLRAMRYALKNGPQQFEVLPELSSSHMLDLDRRLIL